eukprot:m.285432 g.285432  ORF g.285432 m.285432 type:complete len:139 (-) comp16205_c0_seq1:1559-1975(-)
MRCYFLVGENSVIDTTSASSSIRLRLSSIGGRSASKTNGALEVVNGPEHGGSYRYWSALETFRQRQRRKSHRQSTYRVRIETRDRRAAPPTALWSGQRRHRRFQLGTRQVERLQLSRRLRPQKPRQSRGVSAPVTVAT